VSVDSEEKERDKKQWMIKNEKMLMMMGKTS
jgi:hypothetical protein